MGCDIHTYVEVFNDKEKNWVLGQGLRKAGYDEKGKEVPFADRFTDRNYILFGLITNGKVRGRSYNMFEPKGLPKNVSDFVEKEFKKWGNDAHTPSYLTFKEIEEIDKNIKITVSGMMKKSQLKKLKELIKKKNYTQQELDNVLYPYCQWTSTKDTVEFSVEVPITYEIGRFLKYIENAKEYQWGYSGGLDKIRIVFWFDN